MDVFRPLPLHPNIATKDSKLETFATALAPESSISERMGEGFDSLRVGTFDFRALLQMVALGRLELALSATLTATAKVQAREYDARPLSSRVLAIESTAEETSTYVSLTYTEIVTTTQFDATRERVLVGNIALTDGTNYSIRYSGNGQHIIRRADPHFDHLQNDLFMQSLLEKTQNIASDQDEIQPADSLQVDDATVSLPAASTTPSTIAMAIFYTPKVASLHGGMAGVLGFANDCIRQANDALFRSQAHVVLVLAHLSEVAYIESRSEGLDAILAKLVANRLDPEIPVRRKLHACSLATLIVNKPTNGGFTQLLTRDNATSSVYAPIAFSVVDDSAANLVGYHTFAHEVGHFFGCFDKGAVLTKSLCSCARGHDYTTAMGKNCATLMNYSMPEQNRERCLRFSNPSVLHDGVPTGISGTRDHTYLINRTRGLIKDLANHLP